MLGTLLGDLAGSSFERLPGRGAIPHLSSDPSELCPLPEASSFTDDSVCSAAIAESLMTGADPAVSLRSWGRRFPAAGYGPLFRQWLWDFQAPANESFGNGAIMRAAPCWWLSPDEREAAEFAQLQAQASHNHPRAIRAARAMAHLMAAFSRGENPAERARDAGIDVPAYACLLKPGPFRSDALDTLGLALSAVEAARSFEDGLLKTLALGGDTDTNAAVAGAFLELRFFPGEPLLAEALARLASPEFAELGDCLARFLRHPAAAAKAPFPAESAAFASRLEESLRAGAPSRKAAP